MTLCLLILSCSTAPRPKIEHCIIGSTGLNCIDTRREKDQEYYKGFSGALNYICINPQDRVTELEYMQRMCK